MSQLNVLTKQEKRYSAELDDAFQAYDKAKEQAVELDYDELMRERLKLRPDKEQETISRVQSAYGDQDSPLTMFDSQHEVTAMFKGEQEARSVHQMMRNSQPEKDLSIRKRKKQRAGAIISRN